MSSLILELSFEGIAARLMFQAVSSSFLSFKSPHHDLGLSQLTLPLEDGELGKEEEGKARVGLSYSFTLFRFL